MKYDEEKPSPPDYFNSMQLPPTNSLRQVKLLGDSQNQDVHDSILMTSLHESIRVPLELQKKQSGLKEKTMESS